jgi:transcriptional regulator with XRE-family HTH domain
MKQPADIFLDVLREERERRGLKHKDIAAKTGIPDHSLRRWEKGEQRPRLQSAIRLAAELGYRVELVRVA